MKVQVLLRKGFPTSFATARVINGFSWLQAYDKTARLLGLDLKRGGGPALEQLALEGDSEAFSFSVSLSTLVFCPALFASRYLQGF
jgi:hypothetical protein